MKERTRNREVQINEEEIGKLLEKEFIIITVKMIKSLENSQGEESACSAGAAAAKSLQSCPTLCDPIDGSPPGSPVPGILQTRTLEWVVISSSNA